MPGHVMIAYYFTLPASLDVTTILPPRLLRRADDARWLVSTIIGKTANRDTDPWGCVRLHSRILRRVMYEPTLGDVIAALVSGGVIETFDYTPGERSRGFRLTARYLADRSQRVLAVDPRLLDRLSEERKRLDAQRRREHWQPIHFQLADEQRRLSIDPAADAILTTLPDHCRLCQDVLVNRLRHREFSFSVGETGRVFNSITGLKRELRRAVRVDGEPIAGVDIRCAQPALLALEMVRAIPSCEPFELGTYKDTPAGPASLPPASDLSRYVDLVLSGRLYEVLMQPTGLDRDVLKVMLLRDVLAKRGRYPSAVEDCFRRNWPEVYRFVREVNRHDHGELIRRLQRRESWLVIEQVAPRLVDRVPCLTLHDAIYSTRPALPTVRAAFDAAFEAIGFRLALKTE